MSLASQSPALLESFFWLLRELQRRWVCETQVLLPSCWPQQLQSPGPVLGVGVEVGSQLPSTRPLCCP